MTSVFTIKLSHMTTGASMIIPINDNEFKMLVIEGGLYDDMEQLNLLSDIMFRSSLNKDWYDHYNFDGIFLGSTRKD